MYAHKTRFINGLYRAHSVRPYSTPPDYLGFETAWAVRPANCAAAALRAAWQADRCPLSARQHEVRAADFATGSGSLLR